MMMELLRAFEETWAIQPVTVDVAWTMAPLCDETKVKRFKYILATSVTCI